MLSTLSKGVSAIRVLQPISIFNRSIMWNQGATENSVELTFCLSNGTQRKVKARIGDSLKETADAFGISIPGDCRGTGLPRQVFNKEHFTKDIFNSKEGKRCDYCHVILEDSIMDKIPNPAVGEQMWLDNALLNRNKNSRLACQIEVTKEFDGQVVFVLFNNNRILELFCRFPNKLSD